MRVLRRGAGRRPTTVASDPENLEDPGHRLARAVSAGPDVFARLLAEPGFLASASPEMLGPLLWAAGPQAYDAVRVYRRVRPLLGPDVSANAAYLNEAAQALTGAPLAAGPGIRPVYRTRLTSVRRDDALLRWTGHAALAGAAALGTVTGNGEAGGGRLLLASCSDDNTVRLWNPLTGTALGDPLTCHTGHVYWVAFGTFPDGRLLLASCGADRTVRLWDPLAGAPFGEPLTGHTGAVNMVAFGTVTGDGEAGGGRLLLASCSDDNTVRLWDPLTCEPLGGPLKGHTDRAWELTFSTAADHRLLLVSSGFDRTIRFWDPLTQSELGDPLEQPPSMLASGTTPDGRPLLATGNQQGAVRVWDPLSRTLVCEPLTGHPRKVGGVAFGTTPDGQFVLAASTQDDSVRLWEPLTGTPVGEPLYGHTGYGFSLAFGTVRGDGETGGGRLLLASTSGMDILTWDPLAAAHCGRPPAGHTACVTSVAFTTVPGRGPLLASASADESVRLWDPAAGAAAAEPLAGFTGGVDTLAFGTGPAGRPLLAVSSGGNTVRVWDPFLGTPVTDPLAGHTVQVRSLAFGTVTGEGEAGGDRLLLASGGDDHTVLVWEPLTGAPVGQALTGHTGWVDSVAFGAAPDGRLLLASGGGDRTVRLWDPLTCAPLGAPLTGHTDGVRTVAFGTVTGEGEAGGDRLLLASGGDDHTVLVWEPLTGALVGALMGHTGWVAAVAFGAAPDGRLVLASGGGDRTVRVWDVIAGRCLMTIRRHSTVRSLAMAGLLLAIGDDDGLSVIEPDVSALQQHRIGHACRNYNGLHPSSVTIENNLRR